MGKPSKTLNFWRLVCLVSWVLLGGEDVASSAEPILKSRLGEARLQEQIEESKTKEYRQLSGGIFNAPEVHHLLDEMVKRFQKAGVVSDEALFLTFLSSSPEINAYITQDLAISDIKLFKIIFFKGLIDVFRSREKLLKWVSPEKADIILKNSEACLAAVLVHELGHAMHGDTSNAKGTVRVYFEFNADEFAVKALAAAGYDPEAAIWLLEVFDGMNHDKSMKALIAKMLDEHPKPRFRIAHISELVQTLKASKAASDSLQLGYSEDWPEPLPPRALPTAENESTSRTSADGIKNYFVQNGFQKKPMREKFQIIEQYFARRSAHTDSMKRHAIVIFLRQYEELLGHCKSSAEISLLLESVYRFENNFLDNELKQTGDSADNNVNRARSNLRHLITQKQLNILRKLEPKDFQEALDSWIAVSSDVDKRYIYGALIQMVKSAESLEELKTLHLALMDSKRGMVERFKGSKSLSESIPKYAKAMDAAIAVRALHLTKNMDQTLSFLQDCFGVGAVSGLTTVENFVPMIASILQYLLTHDGIEWGNFTQRMNEPKQALDQIFSKLMSEKAVEINSALFELRGALVSGDPLSQQFRYGVGKKFHTSGLPNSNLVSLLYRCLIDRGIQLVFNDLVKVHYSLQESVEVLREECPEQRETFDRLKAAVAQDLVGRRDRRIDLERQLDILEDALERLGLDPAAVASATQAIHETRKRVKAKISENIAELTKLFGQNSSLTVQKGRNEDPKQTNKSLPKTNEAILRFIPPAERVRIFEAGIGTEAENAALLNMDSLLEAKAAISEGILELVSESKATQEVHDDYLSDIESALGWAQKLKAREIQELPFEFFRVCRRLRWMTSVLRDPTIGINSKWTLSAMEAVDLFLDTKNSRSSSAQQSVQRIQSFLLDDPKRAVEYLQNPSQHSGATENFELASSLVRVVSFYEGTLNEDQQSPVASQSAALVDAIHRPAKTVSYNEYDGTSDSPTGVVQQDRPNLYPSELISENERDRLIPLPDSFWEMVRLDQQRTESDELEQKLYERALLDLLPSSISEAARSSDPIRSLIFTLHCITQSRDMKSEEMTRLHYVLLTRALEQVQSQEEMQVFITVFASFLDSNPLGEKALSEVLSSDPKELVKVLAFRYREHFYDRLSAAAKRWDAWEGRPYTISSRAADWRSDWYNLLVMRVKNGNVSNSKIKSCIRGISFVFSLIHDVSSASKRIADRWRVFIQRVEKLRTQALMSQGVGLGPVDPEKFMESARSNTPWSLGLDQAIAERIREEYLVPQRRSKKFRRKAIKLVLSVRSFQLRDQIYKEVLAHFGIIRVGWYQRMKNNLALLKAYKAAEEIWTKEVIEDLRKAGGLLEYFIITEKAWEDHVKKRAVAKGIKTKSDAVKLLIALLEARKTVENPAAAEVAKIFPEGVRYRDSYLEDLAKSRQMDTEQLKMLEDYKSENTESPYHKVAKVMFEFLDEYVAKLKPEERAEIALYLAGYDQKLRPELHDWIHSRVLGTEHRRKSMKEKGFFFSLEEIRTFFQESHSEERMIAYRALFVGQGGISESSTAEDILIQRLLMADPGMPVYLRKVLTLYMRALNASERASLLSWILATNNRGILKGPDIVRLICEKGGVVVAKLAQIIASHGFNLPDEYRHVLEVFKGKAQQIDKAVADKWIRKRLSPEKYAEIKSLDEELGSGSYKIGYAATLVSGQRVVIKLGREYIQYRTAREFEILNHVVEGIMNDPDLRIANLPAIVDEVKRILQQELNMLHESSLMRDHQRAYDARSIWVKLIGQSVSVCFPQPLEGWEKETILVEELVEGRDWDSLPDRAWFGWSKATLARAAVTEILNQLLAFLNPEEHSAEGVLLDIDPHEKNQFARVGRNFSLRKTMVDIDLGESVHVAPEVVRRWVEILYAIDVGNPEAATTMLGDFLDYPDTVNEVWVSSVLSQKYKESSDPLEALTQTMETAELKGVILRSEYLFFQKLFATVVGLKRHIGEKDFIMSQARKILFARVLSQPQQVIPELISIRKSVRDPLCRSLLQDKKASGF